MRSRAKSATLQIGEEERGELFRNAPACVEHGTGLPTLYVFVEPDGVAPGAPARQRVVVDVTCRTGELASAAFTADVTRSTRMALPPCDTIDVVARVLGTGGKAQIVNAFLSWDGQPSGVPVVNTSEPVTLAATVESGAVAVAAAARRLRVLSTNATALLDTVVKFYSDSGTLLYQLTGPGDYIDVVLGAAYVTFTSKVGAPAFNVIALWELSVS